MEMKKCSACGDKKLLNEFHSTGWYRKKGHSDRKMYKPDCKVCANVKWRERYFTRLEKVVNGLGKELQCEHCGWNDQPIGLDFHHLDPTKKDFAIASRWTISEANLKSEIDKCIILCCLCHRLYHAGKIDLGAVAKFGNALLLQGRD